MDSWVFSFITGAVISLIWPALPDASTLPMFYGAYQVGVAIMGAPKQEFAFELSWEWVVRSMETIGPAFLVGCAACSLIFGVLGYFGLNYLWRLSVLKAWKKRRELRELRQQD